ncbi:hypothetical protein L407_04369 [Enterobacter sp. BWH 39]|nr:hypothetical protein L407_04369 [Enterobacter sp. BWH 39]
MLMQHIGVGYFGYYRATAYAMKHSLMPEIAKLSDLPPRLDTTLS